MTTHQLWATAYHEAGHAVIALYLGIGLGRHGVSIRPDEDTHGHVGLRRGFRGNPETQNSDRVRLGLERRAMVSLAGHEAQRQFRSSSVRRHHASQDRANAADCLSFNVGSSEELTAYLHLLQIRVRQIVKLPHIWAQITAVAAALIEKRQLTPTEVRQIISSPGCQTPRRLLAGHQHDRQGNEQ